MNITRTFRIMVIAVVAVTLMSEARAGDREWATAGKVLAGVVAGAVITDALHHGHHGHGGVYVETGPVVRSSTVVYQNPVRVVPPPPVCPPPVVVEQHYQAPVRIIERPYVPCPPQVIIHQPAPPPVYYSSPAACPPQQIIVHPGRGNRGRGYYRDDFRGNSRGYHPRYR